MLTRRCTPCHAENPTERMFNGVAPSGIKFDTPAQMKMHAARIRQRAFVDRTMPFTNRTGMTDDERAILGRWVEEGATLN